MKTPIAIFALLLSAAANADIYEIIDENGRKTYTDKPPHDQPDARPISSSAKSANQWVSDGMQEQNDQYFIELKNKQAEQESIAAELAAQQEEAERLQQQSIKNAEDALDAAKEIKAGDYYSNPNQKGLRYTQEYRDRVQAAEAELEQARQGTATDTDQQEE